MSASSEMGQSFVAPPGVPAPVVEALRRAFDATMKDAQFLAETEKLDLPVDGPVDGPEAERIVASIYAASPTLIARAQTVVGK